MTSISFLINGPDINPDTSGDNAKATIVFAHGAGAPMDTEFMTFFAHQLGNIGYRVLRFEFPFMAERRLTGKKRPPDRAPKLLDFWQEVIASTPERPLFIMGKSLGGRMASMIADQANVTGVICLGYPFHPPGKPEKTRTEHLLDITTPTLIIQGTRDPFGKPEEVKTYRLSEKLQIDWSPDGDHNITPRKKSGRTSEDNWREAVHHINFFIQSLSS